MMVLAYCADLDRLRDLHDGFSLLRGFRQTA